MPEKRWTTYLNTDSTARMRVRFTADAGVVTAFVVQLEVLHGTRWRAAVRYDGHHGFAHCDRHRLNGDQRKDPLNLDYGDSLTYAVSDIKARWNEYTDRFLRGDYP